jgi:hypothetical protein
LLSFVFFTIGVMYISKTIKKYGPARQAAWRDGSSGAGRDGSVIVTIPSKGTGLPVNDLTSDLGALRTPLHEAYGLGAPVELGRGSAIVHRHGRDYGISVQPIDAQFAEKKQTRDLVRALETHLPRR